MAQSAGRFAYALMSAAPLRDTSAAGIAVVFKARDRSTLRTVCQAVPDSDVLAAGYEALMQVLEEALRTGARRITVYTDLHEVVDQLKDDADVPRWLLVTHLKTRAMINQVGAVKLVVATSDRFSARRIAESARVPEERADPRSHRRQDQLRLSTEDALA
ncbi:MAG: reverse transcriptase-like protein [Armatimonadota bacterium]